jgi:hypothetical protein
MEGLYYDGIESLSEFPSTKDADLQLHQNNGWILLKIEKLTNDETDGQGVVKRSERLVFILGRKRVGSNPTPPPASTASAPSQPPSKKKETPKFTESDLEALDWMDSDYGGQWIPKDRVGGAVAEFFKAHGEKGEKSWKVHAGENTYYLTTSGNLKRYTPEDSER